MKFCRNWLQNFLHLHTDIKNKDTFLFRNLIIIIVKLKYIQKITFAIFIKITIQIQYGKKLEFCNNLKEENYLD